MCRDWVGFQKVIEEAADAFGHVCSRAVKARMHLGMLHCCMLFFGPWHSGVVVGLVVVFGLSVFPACSALVACWSLVLDQCRVGLVLWACFPLLLPLAACLFACARGRFFPRALPILVLLISGDSLPSVSESD